MTLYYSLVFALLVTEMAGFLLLVAPLPTSFRKNIILFVKKAPIMPQIILTLRFTFFFITILFVDSVNRVYRVQQEIQAAHESGMPGQNLNADRSEIQARRFYAQRNMYLCGFTLFLSYILSATYTLVLNLADAEEQLRATGKGAGADADTAEVEELKETIRKQNVDLDALKRQYKGLTTEYDRVADDLNEKSGTLPGNKKTD